MSIMKNLSLIFLSIMLAGFISCSKTEDPAPTNNTTTTDTNYYFTAKVDGTDWTADMQSSNTSAKSFHAGSITIQASLTDVTKGVFLMNIMGYNGAGTYTVGTGGNNNYIRYTTGTAANGSYSAWKAETPGSTTTGTVTITKDENGVIEGTLEFEGYSEETKDIKKITEGKFRMKMQ